MSKKVLAVIFAMLTLSVVVFVGAGIGVARANQPEFGQGGYILQAADAAEHQLAFTAGESYAHAQNDRISFRTQAGARAEVPQKSFLHLDDGSIVSLSDGVLLDFNDLSENFINNYYVTAGVAVTASGNGYAAQSASGTVTLGDYLWKLSDQVYLIQSDTLTVHFSDTDERPVDNFVEVCITDDGIAQILTSENSWSTISPDCYITTAGGIQISPVTQLVDGGSYKMSLAKLSVGVDDAIVLTTDETRRQIVPELNINTVDGEDGQDGDEGVAGEEGFEGEEGLEGEEGGEGSAGQNSGVGATGSAGETGAGGAGGTGGGNGGVGAGGKDAMGQSSTNTVLPSMTISAWNVSATSLQGTISVKDESGLLSNVFGEDDTAYAGRVTVYNVATGEAVPCRMTTTTDTTTFKFAHGSDEGFATMEPLVPDTSYRLSVVAYYKAQSSTGQDTVYSREFISRVFYTDSTGIALSYDSATSTSIDVNAALAASYQSAMKTADVYLLTPTQNESVTQSPSGSVGHFAINYKDSNISDEDGNVVSFANNGSSAGNVKLSFENLSPNTNYVVRVIAHTEGADSLTRQELSVVTLKEAPTWAKDGKPIANYNRISGAFEVSRPRVTDPQGGIEKYVYTAICSSGKEEDNKSITVNASTGDPVLFYLPTTNVSYTFNVKAQFNDNEKTITYDLGTSESIQVTGDTLPGVTLTIDPDEKASNQEYNRMKGEIFMVLGKDSSLTVSDDSPLKLRVYADQVYDRTINITGKGVTITDKQPNAQDDDFLYSATLKEDGNNVTIDLTLNSLYKNSNYTITLTGALNLGDGNSAADRAIGTVSFRTYATSELNTVWSISANTNGTAIGQNLQVVPLETDTRKNYAISQLQQGKCTLELYRGTGTGKVRLAYSDVTEPDILKKIYGPAGYDVTEKDFGNITLAPSTDYTLAITNVVDGSYDMNLGYENTYDTVHNSSHPIVAAATPPDLLSDPAKGVTATPILNMSAADYGSTVQESLPDDAVIGYVLQANYDNVQRLGYSVTYYAMEYNTFYSAVVSSGVDPLAADQVDGNTLMKMTQRIDTSSDTVPKVAVLFGRSDMESTKSDAGATYQNGCYVYVADEGAITTVPVGLGRGFRYVFAYTVQYSADGTFDETGGGTGTLTYPNSHASYKAYKNAYGVGNENWKTLGKGTAYILNSGMCEAPKIEPEFHSYLYEATGEVDAVNVTAGKAEIRFKFRDLDGAIQLTAGGGTSEITQIETMDENKNLVKSDINAQANDLGDGWYRCTTSYFVNDKDSTEPVLVEPRIYISRYLVNYGAILEALGYAEKAADAEEPFYLCHLPVEWAWGSQLADSDGKITFTAKMNESANLLEFNFANSQDLRWLASRVYSLKITLTDTDPSSMVEPVVIYTTMKQDETQNYYAEIPTGLLDKLLNKTFRASIEALYDNGNQGWSQMDTAGKLFAFQFINTTTYDGPEFALGSYLYSGTGGSSILPGGALVSVPDPITGNAATTEKLQNTLSDLQNPKKTDMARYYYLNAPTYSNAHYLYVDHYGVDASGYQSVETLSGRYLTLKDVSTIGIEQSNSDTLTLTRMTPTIQKGSLDNSTNSVTVRSDFVVSARTDIRDDQIYVQMYTSKEGAERLNGNDLVPGTRALIFKDTNADGKPDSVNITDGKITSAIGGIQKNTTYYLAFYYVGVSDGKAHLLLDSSTSDSAVYSITTISGVSVSSAQGAMYTNDSYFEKKVTINFNLSKALGFRMSYDVFESEAAAGKGEDDKLAALTPYMTDAELREKTILTAPTTPNTSNQLTLELAPRPDRKAFVPGKTYYLRLSVLQDLSDGSVDEVGHGVWPFTLTAVGNYGAYIYASNATKDSLDFQVTASDSEFSFMSENKDTPAKYAVRFTDLAGNRLITNYDNILYDTTTPKQPFVLNNDALVLYAETNPIQEIKPSTGYVMHVYAMIDTEHDGLSALVAPAASGGEGKDSEYLFADSGQTTPGGESVNNFQNLINSFWKQDGNDYIYNDIGAISKGFEIATKTQKTTDEQGIFVNVANASMTRTGTQSLQMVLAESYGIVTGEGEEAKQAFKRIDWSVTGIENATQNPIALNGSSRDSISDAMFAEETDAAGYSIYSYNLPAKILSGNYNIVIQLYKMETDTNPYQTLSFAFRG